MADNYLENHYDEWLKKKAEWERKGRPKVSRKTADKKSEKSGQ